MQGPGQPRGQNSQGQPWGRPLSPVPMMLEKGAQGTQLQEWPLSNHLHGDLPEPRDPVRLHSPLHQVTIKNVRVCVWLGNVTPKCYAEAPRRTSRVYTAGWVAVHNWTAHP